MEPGPGAGRLPAPHRSRLAAELELRRHIERVAAQRRALPPGGEAPRLPVQGRERQRPSAWPTCSASTTRWSPTSGCTGRSASAPARCAPPSSARWTSRPATSTQRVAVAVIGRSPVERQLAFARERGWRNLKFYATVGDDFARDYRGLAPDGSEWPALDVWVPRGRPGAALLGRRSWAAPRPGQTRAARPTRRRCGTCRRRSSRGSRPGGGTGLASCSTTWPACRAYPEHAPA